MAYRYPEYFEPSRPREAKGGIKAQSGRGGFGRSWWARRWIEVLEGLDLGARLGRGRSYARRGQVLSINVEKGGVTARVQGSRARPYRVEIKISTLGRSDWKKLTTALSGRPIFAAKLLAGQMPDNIEDVFRDAGLSLFPDKGADLETDCSCPDWSNPCKHIAAVYFLLGEESLSAWLDARRRQGARRAVREVMKRLSGLSPSRHQVIHRRSRFPRIPTISAALPKRLGSFPFWRGKESFIPALEEIYRKASPVGLDVFLGERQGSE